MLILFYKKRFNTFFSIHDNLRINELSNLLPKNINIVFSDNKELLYKADAVIFDLPFIHQILRKEDEIVKPNAQIWVAWCLESEVNYPWIFSSELKELFDIYMTYHLDSDVVLPYYDYSFLEKLYTPVYEKAKDVCMFISSPVNKSKRLEYLSELMEYIHIDSYGTWRRNCRINEDSGYKMKLDIIKRYKFTIAFENAISKDYVTEKFFDPLIMGSVPIYFGAPNIDDFSPGDYSFIDTRNYDSPKSLAEDIKKYCTNDPLYEELLKWKKYPLKTKLRSLIDIQRKHPFERLVDSIRLFSEKNKNHSIGISEI